MTPDQFFKRIIIAMLLFTSVVSCNNDDINPIVPPAIENEYLISSTKLFTRELSVIKFIISASGITELTTLSSSFEYNVAHYEVTYKTTYLGQEIVASGLVSFPQTLENVPVLSFQIGTIAGNDEAPTENQQEFLLLSSLASAGYIFVIPDYIGFGASSDLVSPYHSEEYTARAVIDLLKATKELALSEGYNFNGDTFLAGYSEGGYATMAAHKALEEENPDGFQLIASAPASGGYDVKGFQSYIFGLEKYDNPFFMAYAALSYKIIYGYDDPLSDLFQEPYASIIPDLFDGSNEGEFINSQLNTTISELIQPDILINIDTDPKYSNFVNALHDNSLTNWIPVSKMFMYHGTEDITVPYQNSVDTYQKLLDAGASTSVVQLINLVGEDHSSGVYPYMQAALSQFAVLK